MENILFKVGICREIDGREWDVAKQAGTGPFIQTKHTQLAYDVGSTMFNCSF